MGATDFPVALAQNAAETERLAREGVARVPPADTVAIFVRIQRIMLDWKQGTLASFAGVSLSTVERIERGEPVSPESLNRVATALKQPPGAFTEPRVPCTAEEAVRRLEASAAPFQSTVAVPVRPLRGHRQITALARTHLNLIDAGRLGDTHDDVAAILREWLDLISFVLASEDEDSILRADRGAPAARRKLYDDVLCCVREVERRARAVALAGIYKAETGVALMPTADVALVAFFPRLTDPGAVKRRTLFAPARIDMGAAWRQFCDIRE